MFVPLASPAWRGLSVALTWAALAVLAGCGPGGNWVGVAYNGYSIETSRSAAQAGDVIFRIANLKGQVLHQLLIVQTDTPANQLPLGANGQVDESALKLAGRVDQVDVGQLATLTAHLTPSHYVLLCNIVGHYQLGMHTDFTVTP